MKNNAIEIQGLTKRFRERIAVDNLNLTIEQGEIFALLGPNGAGKTTTVRMLAGLAVPTSGDALLMGNSIVKNPESARKLANISPQETAVAERLSVRENIEFIARLYGADKKTAHAQATDLINRFALSGRENDRVKTLSGGMQRKLSIAMALVSNPSVLFLDEPTLGLDVRARRDLWKMIEELKGSVTIVLTTHYLEEAEHLASHIGIMNRGKLAALGTPEEITESAGTESFEDAFLKLTDEGDIA